MKKCKRISILLVLAVFLINLSPLNIFGRAYAGESTNNLNKSESSPASSEGIDPEVSEILVKYRSNTLSGSSSNSGLHEGDSNLNLKRIQVDIETDLALLMDNYRNDPDVESVQPNYVYKSLTVNDPYRSEQWGLDVIQADSAWIENTSMGEGVTVAIVDTGIDLDHEDLSSNIVGGYNAIDGGSYDDDNGHGTHVAGIVAALPDNGKGIAGVAGRAKLLAVKVLNKDAKGTTESVAKGIRWAADNGADVINLSLGNYRYDEILRQAIYYAHDKGCFIVAAAGNDGIDEMAYPASFEVVFAVGAVNESGGLASFSNNGAKISAVAPGVNIVSTLPNHLKVDGMQNYGAESGTSMAAPFVSGIAALIKSKYPSHTWRQIAYEIGTTATDAGIWGHDINYGSGIVNAVKALGGTSPEVVLPKKGDSLEDNNGNYNATEIKDTAHFTASMYPREDSDWYKLIVPTETKVSLQLKPQSDLDIAMDIYENDEAMSPRYHEVDNGEEGTAEKYTLWPSQYNRGYYIKVTDAKSGNSLKNYELNVTYSPMMSSGHSNTGIYVMPQRLSGVDRYHTSSLIAQEMYDTTQYAILATGEDYSDALSAAPISKKYRAPIILTNPNDLNEFAWYALRNLEVKNVFIIGGPGAISPNVEKKLNSMGINYTRIYGKSRYETSLAVANYLGPVEGAFIASGESFADALSVSSLAAKLNYPILLTQKDELPAGISDYISSKGINKTYVIGGSGVISDSVMDKVPNSKRIWGSDRYETNIKVLEEFKDIINIERVYLATGEDYPDALSGSVFASYFDSPLILVSPYAGKVTKTYIRSNASKIFRCYIFGGPGAVSDIVFFDTFGYYRYFIRV